MTARPTAPLSPSTPAGQSLGAMPGYASSCGRATLYLGDCLSILPALEGVDAVVTDPPYGMSYAPSRSLKKCKKWQSQKPFVMVEGDSEPFDPAPLLRLKKPLVTWGANHYASKMPDSAGWLTWDKKRGGQISKGFIGSDVEHAWTNARGTAKIFDYMWCGLCRDGEVGEHYHPTQKPVRVMAWCMEMANIPEGATVLDPYMGSGTTGIACIRTNRRFIGIEKDPTHYATALERITAELAQGDLFRGQNDPSSATADTKP
jgi:site-specific DNA-methyltransferase (adenine-specific)